MLGGRLHKRSVSALGAVAAEAARAPSPPTSPCSSWPGCTRRRGLTAGEAEEAALRRILISRTADTYVLASIEKLGTVCPYTVTGLSEVAGIITDAPAGHPAVARVP